MVNWQTLSQCLAIQPIWFVWISIPIVLVLRIFGRMLRNPLNFSSRIIKRKHHSLMDCWNSSPLIRLLALVVRGMSEFKLEWNLEMLPDWLKQVVHYKLDLENMVKPNWVHTFKLMDNSSVLSILLQLKLKHANSCLMGKSECYVKMDEVIIIIIKIYMNLD